MVSNCEMATNSESSMTCEIYYFKLELRRLILISFYHSGIVILDVLWCYEEDSGVYECRAENKLGKDTTSAVLRCSPKPSLIFDPQIPKVIVLP